MFCGKCGAVLTSDTKFCPSCGSPVVDGMGKGQALPFPPVGQSRQATDIFSPDNLQKIFLSSEGRLNRKPYLIYSLILCVIQYILMEITGDTVGTIVGLIFVYPSYCLDIRRLHDIGNDERIAIIAAVASVILIVGGTDVFINSPFFAGLLVLAALGTTLYMLFTEGTRGPNAFGSDPLEWKH